MGRLSSSLRREGLSLILAGAVAALIINCIDGPHGVRDLMTLRAERSTLEARLERISAENTELGTRIQKLRSDDRYIERVIRSELGFARPDEMIYRFADDGTPPNP